VESADTAAALLAMGCVAAQGWHFCRPLNAASATAWLAEHGEPVLREARPVNGRAGETRHTVVTPVVAPPTGWRL
jgi:hypothetical protein